MTGQMTALAAQAHVDEMHRRAELRRRAVVERDRAPRRLTLRWPGTSGSRAVRPASLA